MKYDYRCNKCEHIWEVNCPMSESSYPRDCPICVSTDTEKYFGNTTVNFGGSGGGLTPKKVPESFKDVLRNIKDKAVGGKHMVSSVI